tara:strand:+ start:140 stop:910 length:771 start_codon:yes stop_codon:yes gene_type:complete
MKVNDFYVNSPNSALHSFAKKNHCEHCKKKLANENFFKPVDIVKVTINTNDAIKKIFEVVLKDVHLDLLDVIDLKQMGQFIGSIFIQKVHETVPYLAKTPSPTGHPDLIPKAFEKPPTSQWAQGYYDQFKHGGVEVKTSVIKTPDAKNYDIGRPRIEKPSGVEWKGHHQDINNLLGLVWDFMSNVPTILAGFYSDRLRPDDFTYSDQKPGGGHTTNVAITKSSAKEKMGLGWVFCIKEERYKEFLSGKLYHDFKST